MKKILFICLFALIPLFNTTIIAQTQLNENGIYELKIVEQYENKNASVLYQQSLITLSDVCGNNKSKINIDVADKDANIIIYKGEFYLGFKKVNTMYGYDVYAVFTLKIKCKDNKVQYIVTVPSLHMYWTAKIGGDEVVPLNEIIPEFTHKSKLYYLKKGAIEYAPTIDYNMKMLQKTIVDKTKTNITNDDF